MTAAAANQLAQSQNPRDHGFYRRPAQYCV